MKIVFCGDVVGKSGRKALLHYLPEIKDKLAPDFVIVNGENAAHGFGLTGKICQSFYEAGVDVITTGNHVWDQKEIIAYIDTDPRLIRPANYPEGTPGRGSHVYETASGKKVLVVQIMGSLYMCPLHDPFAALEKALAPHQLGKTVDAVVVDIHCEATSEKMAFGHVSDGRASLVVGTHTHIPTADTFILPGGTAYQTDVGMCGDYDSVIGMKKEGSLARFTKKMPSERLAPAEGEGTLCGVLVETSEETGLAKRVEPIRLGGWLPEVMPGE